MKVAKFLTAGLVTALLDNGIFFALNRATGVRFLSLSIATLFSVTFNYLVSRLFVFETRANHALVLPKYLGVHGVGLVMRYGMLEGLIALFHIPSTSLGVNACKLAADGVVYSLKYFVQRDFVFRHQAIHNAAPESDRSGWPAVPESIQPAPQPQTESLP